MEPGYPNVGYPDPPRCGMGLEHDFLEISYLEAQGT